MSDSDTGSEEYRSRRATHKFMQACQPTMQTMPFFQLPSGVQSYLTRKCKSAAGDLPVVVCFIDNDNWCLLTTRLVHWSCDGEYHCLRYDEIKQVGWSAGPGAAKKRTYVDQIDMWMETDEGRVRTKTASPWFFIFEKEGRRHELRLEVGAPQTGMWDAIEMLIRLEQIHPRSGVQV